MENKFNLDKEAYKKLSFSEQIVYDDLINTHGAETAIKASQFTERYGFNRCKTAGIVSSLRLKGVPICSSKGGEHRGYYMPKRKNELLRTMEDFEQQASAMLSVIHALSDSSKGLSLVE